jgi:hypothetical protein
MQDWGFTPWYLLTYDGISAKHEQTALSAVPERVAEERATIKVMRGEEAVAVISPAPDTETLAELHRVMVADGPDSLFSLEKAETRDFSGCSSWRSGA